MAKAKKKTKKKRATKKTPSRKSAKRKRRINKSQKIRDYLTESPEAQPSEVVEALGKSRIKVTPGQVSQVKWQMSQQGGGKAKRKGRRGRSQGDVNLGDLLKAKQLAEQMGGVEEAQKALDALAKLR